MCTEVGCIPYVVVVAVLHVTLTLSGLVVNVDCWCGCVGTEFFGMVMLLNPMVPLSPVTVKETKVVLTDWFVAIVTLDICV